jgi:glycine cleavage system aminomethyltransferase T
MGEIEVRSQARSRSASGSRPTARANRSDARSTLWCTDDGGTIGDTILYRLR